MSTRPEYPNRFETPEPVEDRRLSGAHWWDPDRVHHLQDLPRFCPNCAGPVTGAEGISVEYWEADRKVYHTWCNTCGWSGQIMRVERMIGHEPED